MKQCYANAGQLAMERPDLLYCEGFALRPNLFPMHHAWCITAGGEVVDPTWPHEPGMEYHGVVVRPEYLEIEILRTQHWGLFAERIPDPTLLLEPERFLHPLWPPAQEDRDLFVQAVQLVQNLKRA